jgi:hypothetical protein
MNCSLFVVPHRRGDCQKEGTESVSQKTNYLERLSTNPTYLLHGTDYGRHR